MRALFLIALAVAAGDTRVRSERARTREAPAPATSCRKSLQGKDVESDWVELHAANGIDTTPILTRGYAAGPSGSCGHAMRLQVAANATAAGYMGMIVSTPPSASYSGDQMCNGTFSNISWGYWVYSASSQAFDMCLNDNANGWHCAVCTPRANDWKFCKVENAAWWNASNAFAIGNLPALNGGSTRAALDITIWGPRCVVATTISQ